MRPLTIRQIGETDVIRMRHGWIARVEQGALAQKNEAAIVRTIQWRERSTSPIIELCHPTKTSHAPR